MKEKFQDDHFYPYEYMATGFVRCRAAGGIPMILLIGDEEMAKQCFIAQINHHRRSECMSTILWRRKPLTVMIIYSNVTYFLN